MSFYETLTITIIDKLVIAALLLVAGFWLNRFLERFRASSERETDRHRLRDQKRVEFVERHEAPCERGPTRMSLSSR